MKKLLLLLLVFTGMVSTASATDYVVAGVSAIANGKEWDNNASENVMTAADANHYYLVVHNCNLYAPTNEYPNKYTWQVVEKGTWDGFKTSTYDVTISEDGTYTLIFIVNISTGDLNVVPVKNLTLSNNYGSNNTWNTDNSSFYFSYVNGTKWAIDIDANDVSADWRFRIWTSGILSWDGWHNIAASSEGESLAIASNDDGDYAANDTDNSWEVKYPSYSFDKYTISIEYDVVNLKWVVSADAYISKTLPVSENGIYYGTFGSEANVDFSGLSDLTAQKITAANLSTGVLTPVTATTLYAGEGALLSAETAGPFSIPVAASAEADASNLLVAGTGDVVAEEVGIYTNFILTNKKDVNGTSTPADLKFYRINESKAIPAGSAYLRVQTGTTAPDFLWFNDMTGIEKVSVDTKALDGAVYNLNGQRVAQPTKGLYIVNGKKVVLK